MDKSEWEALFESLATGGSSAPAEFNTAVPTQDEYLTIDTDSEDHVSVAPSVYSLTSSLRTESFRRVHGRSLNAHSDIYHLPADEEEVARLYAGLEHGKEFDISCLYAFWVLTSHPQVHREQLSALFSCDLKVLSNPPPNCHFEIDDLNLGLEHFFGPTFDLIHTRLLNSGIKDYAGLVSQVSRCLRPGGMAIFVEADFRIWSEDKRVLIPPNFYTPLPAQGRAPLGLGGIGKSAVARSGRVRTVPTNWATPAWMATMCKCVRAQGGNVDAPTLLKTWMREHPNYVDVQAIDLWAPAGPWAPTKPNDWTQHPNFIPAGEMSRDNVIGLMKSARPLLYQWLSEAEVAELEGNVVRELKSAVNPMYLRIQVAAGYSLGSCT
ncbi:hypothetical protein BDV93DRAFT_554853 [Ceratobasidium sp. AG-I]|nr:hypothetical protein BDV93DRAFT_554853 [Ceratobasidium sp. AG-I]